MSTAVIFWTGCAMVAMLSLWAAGHALVYKRDPRSALGWLLLSLLLPLAGPFFYWLLGINRVQSRARYWQDSGRRLALEPGCQGEDLVPESVFEDRIGHLAGLRLLGDRVVGSPLLPGNEVVPLVNGDACYPAMLAAIEGASRSIHLSSYIFDGYGVGRQVADALVRASCRGVAVRVIVDALGEKYSRPPARSLFRGSGVQVGRFLPLRHGGHLNLRNHRKLLLVDDAMAFTGGMNIAERHILGRGGWCHPVADIHFLLRGPAVAEVQRTFLEDWHFVTGELLQEGAPVPCPSPCGGALVRTIADGPDLEMRPLHAVILGALASARRRVLVMTPYFIPDRALLSAFNTASLRGVEVCLVLPSRNNLPLVHWASRAYLWELLQQGVRIFYQPPPFVHSKLMVVDDRWCLVGSANLDPRSLRLNFEFDLEVYDCGVAEGLAARILVAMAAGREVSLAEMDGRPLRERLRDGAAKLLSPYL